MSPHEGTEFLRLGVCDYVILPLRASDILPRIWRLLDTTQQHDSLTQSLKENLGLKQLIGQSPAFQREIQKIPHLAQIDATALIMGETGTGKELAARAR